MGAATFSQTGYSVFGNRRIVLGDVTLSTSYAAGGDTLAASALGLSTVEFAAFEGLNSLIELKYDRANGKVQAFFPVGGSPTAPTTLVDPVGATGAVAVTSSAATLPIVPGRAKEVAATANLSTVVGRAYFIGV